MTSGAAACSDEEDSPWTFTSDDFMTTTVFSEVRDFFFLIEVSGPLSAGMAFDNPGLSLVEYRVVGVLAEGTPSEFPAFDLQRTIVGSEFYDQGSSLRFEIAAGADLSDGVQVSELVGTSTVFTFDGREVDNGRFHPSRLELRADGTGRIQNSNNVPTVEPNRIDVTPGSEYITDLTFNPSSVTVIESAR